MHLQVNSKLIIIRNDKREKIMALNDQITFSKKRWQIKQALYLGAILDSSVRRKGKTELKTI